MNRVEIAFPAVLSLLAGGLIAGGVLLAGYSWQVVAFPLGAAAIVCGLSVVLIATRLARGASETVPPADEQSAPAPLTWSSIAWIFLLGIFLYGLGFVFGPAAYLLVYLRRNGSRWLTSLAISAGSLLVTWGLFIKLLRVLLPIQPLWLG
jgi:hypothetical protein